jgi:hypothetical protein
MRGKWAAGKRGDAQSLIEEKKSSVQARTMS